MKQLSLEGLNFSTTEVNIKDKVMTITLDRPEKKNAMNNVMMNEINYLLAYAKQEKDIRVVVFAANGDVFCAGADLSRTCLLYTSPSPRDRSLSRMPSSA